MIKILYTFEVGREQEVEKQIESTNEQGEKVTTSKKIKENVSSKYYIAKPSRALQEAGEEYRMVKFSEAFRKGILTHDLMSKRLQNDDGVLSDNEKKTYKEWYEQLYQIQEKIQKIATKLETERTEEEKKEFDELVNQLKTLRKTIRNFELSKSSLFDLTAENYARNKLVFWYLLYLSYQTNAKGEPEPFFAGKNFDEKLEKYDEVLDKNDPYLNQLVQKYLYFVTLWFISEVSDPEQFVKLVKEAEESETPEKQVEQKLSE